MWICLLRGVARWTGDLIFHRYGWAAILIGVSGAALVTGVPAAVTDDEGCGATAELVMAAGADLSRNQQRQELVNAWNLLHAGEPGNLRARQVELAPTADQQRSQLAAALQSGSCQYDVLNLDLPWIPEFAQQGYIEPLPDLSGMRSEFIPSTWQTGVVGATPYAIPFTSDAGLLFYDAELVKKPPQTSAELDQLAAELRDPSTGGLRGGLTAIYAGQFARYEGLTVNVLESIAEMGGDLFAPLGSPSSLAAKQALDKLVARTQAKPPVLLPESTRAFEAESLQAFIEGKVALLRHWPYAFKVLDAEKTIKFGVAQLPGPVGRQVSVLGGHSLAIPSSSRHKVAARKLIRFLTEAASQQLLFSCGTKAPTREDAYRPVKCAEAQKTRGVPGPDEAPETPETRSAEVAQLTVLGRELLTAIKAARSRPATPYYTEFSEALQCRVHQSLRLGRPLTEVEFSRLVATVQNPSKAGAGCG